MRCQPRLILSSATHRIWSSRYLSTEQNFCTHQVTVLGSTASLLFWWFPRGSNSQSISSRIRQRYTFVCVAYNPNMEWCNAQRVCAPTTTTLPTTMSTYHGLNYFTHVIYHETSTYKTIAELSTHPSILQALMTHILEKGETRSGCKFNDGRYRDRAIEANPASSTRALHLTVRCGSSSSGPRQKHPKLLNFASAATKILQNFWLTQVYY